MTQTTLMESMDESVVDRPAVMIQPAVVVGVQNRSGLVKSPAWQDRIDSDLDTHADPEPVQARGDPPAGLIEPVHHTVLDRDLKLLIGRVGLVAQPQDRPAQRAAADMQTVTQFQNSCGALMRDPHFLVQM